LIVICQNIKLIRSSLESVRAVSIVLTPQSLLWFIGIVPVLAAIGWTILFDMSWLWEY